LRGETPMCMVHGRDASKSRIFLIFVWAAKNTADGAKRLLVCLQIGSSRTQSSSSSRRRSRRRARARARARSLFNRCRRPECRTALAVTHPPNRTTPECAPLKLYYLYYWTYYVCARVRDRTTRVVCRVHVLRTR